MPSRSKQAFTGLQETVADGRLANTFFRRQQLSRLHDGLKSAKTSIVDAIVRDSGNNRAEAVAELHMVFSAVKSFHDEIKPQEELDLEYRIAKGQDATQVRTGFGIVVITPEKHSLLYSILTPLSAAIAAGNAVVVVIEKNLRILPPLIATLLQESLDPDIYEISSTRVETGSINALHVIQHGETDTSNSHVLYSPSSNLTVAIVDRTADLDAAAVSLIKARFAFGGTSPYAPDIILVNEFAKRDFLHAARRHVLEYLTEAHDETTDRQRLHPNHQNGPKTDEVARDSSQTLVSSAKSAIVEVDDRSALANFSKVRHKSLYIHSFSSLDDAIEVANNLESGISLATYVFADWKTCKYVLQFVEADIGLANIVPAELLVGPALPRGHIVGISPRYTTSLFSVPRPKYAKKSGLALELEEILGATDSTTQESVLARNLSPESRVPIKHIPGYFERGVIVGGIATVSPILLGLSAATYYFFLRKLLSP
ncbi:aldehyde dehydrogenase [Xylaria palmicola]|nr:aldehyde dehydrogenase [Xylaria palmicola]